MNTSVVVDTIQHFFDRDNGKEGELPGQQLMRFFRPAEIIRDDASRIAAFTRDISRDGVGMLHDEPIIPGPVRIEIELGTGVKTSFDATVLWCREHAGNYVSCARFREESRR